MLKNWEKVEKSIYREDDVTNEIIYRNDKRRPVEVIIGNFFEKRYSVIVYYSTRFGRKVLGVEDMIEEAENLAKWGMNKKNKEVDS